MDLGLLLRQHHRKLGQVSIPTTLQCHVPKVLPQCHSATVFWFRVESHVMPRSQTFGRDFYTVWIIFTAIPLERSSNRTGRPVYKSTKGVDSILESSLHRHPGLESISLVHCLASQKSRPNPSPPGLNAVCASVIQTWPASHHGDCNGSSRILPDVNDQPQRRLRARRHYSSEQQYKHRSHSLLLFRL